MSSATFAIAFKVSLAAGNSVEVYDQTRVEELMAVFWVIEMVRSGARSRSTHILRMR
jgi:hypothetical protein